MQRIHPVPEDLSQRWGDYRFVHLYNRFQRRIRSRLLGKRDEQSPGTSNAHILVPPLRTICALQSQINGQLPETLVACWELFYQPPHLIHIFQARRLHFSDESCPNYIPLL